MRTSLSSASVTAWLREARSVSVTVDHSTVRAALCSNIHQEAGMPLHRVMVIEISRGEGAIGTQSPSGKQLRQQQQGIACRLAPPSGRDTWG